MSGEWPHGPWRNPHEHRRLVVLRRGGPGVYELTVYPGADVLDLVGATARLPKVVYVDYRRVAPGDAAVVLVFRALPDGPAGMPVRPPADGAPPTLPGWVPDVEAVRAQGARTALEEAFAALLTPAAFGLHGRILVHGLAHCDPAAVMAAAELARDARAGCR